jgi:glycerophosphoryl diester phosphodiesterase
MRSPSLRPSLTCLVGLIGLVLALGAQAFDLQGHRGARGHLPENTLAAFDHAMSLGVTTLELDVGVTADGVVVVHHDRALNPSITRDASGQWLASTGPRLNALTLAQLQAYDVGRIRPGTAYAREFVHQQALDVTRVPTLDALFERVAQRGAQAVRFNIETKIDPRAPADTLAPDAFVQALLASVDRHGMAERVMVQSFDWRTLRLVQQMRPRIPTAYLTSTGTLAGDTGLWTAGLTLGSHGGSIPALVKAAGGSIWSPGFRDLTGESLREAHALGLQVIPWTVNEPADIERMLGLGVDGLISDYPDRVRDVMRERRMALPRPAPPGGLP